VDAEHDGRVYACHVAAERMLAVPGSLAAVPDLEAVLVRRPSIDRRRVAAERVAEHADPLVTVGLDSDVDRRTVRSADVEHLAAGALHSSSDEAVQVIAAGDAVDLHV
jgi:hypothetical protein